MATNDHIRAHLGDELNAKPSTTSDTDLTVVAQHMFMLMMRNVTSDGFVLVAPNDAQQSWDAGSLSQSGCVIAAPSYPGNTPRVDQDYVFNWVRDAAITAMEILAADFPAASIGGVQSLVDYVNFARLCQQNVAAAMAAPSGSGLSLGHACYTIDGRPRPWSEQSDGPALQIIAVMHAYDRLDAATKSVADELIRINLDYLMENYQKPTTNLWEEHLGFSFFTRAVHLRCFQDIAVNALGIAIPSGIESAIAWLQDALGKHWNGQSYVSVILPSSGGSPPAPPGYDPNIDIVSACLYGAVPPTDTRLLATAAQLRSQWADPNNKQSFYLINGDDAGRGFGPMLGRYPGDFYDGDTAEPVPGGHPWALCTCNFAELYYRLAATVAADGKLPWDELSGAFFGQVGIASDTSASDASEALRAAGDRMMQAVIFHSDHLELSEQFDGTTGYEKSVTNLTWSYAAFLSAVRARAERPSAG